MRYPYYPDPLELFGTKHTRHTCSRPSEEKEDPLTPEEQLILALQFVNNNICDIIKCGNGGDGSCKSCKYYIGYENRKFCIAMELMDLSTKALKVL